MDDEIRERLSSETWENNLNFLIAYCEEDNSLKDILENEFNIELQEGEQLWNI
mgnify:FL=1